MYQTIRERPYLWLMRAGLELMSCNYCIGKWICAGYEEEFINKRCLTLENLPCTVVGSSLLEDFKQKLDGHLLRIL